MRKCLSLFTVLMLFYFLASAQLKTISGKITDANGQPVPYSSVHVKGTKAGTVADGDGNYALRAKPGDVLVVSGTGIAQKEATVGVSGTLDISVSRSNASLTEVVVTALGIKRESKALGYSTATISSDQLNAAKPINPAQGLIAQVSGAQVSIINNGVDPQVRIQLRGERHINYDNSALLVVDGLQIPSGLAGTTIAAINPEDIESTTILKGASAAALYGSQATNGVVIITTKRGSKNGKASVNVSQTGTIQRMAYFPKLQTTYSGYGGETGVWFGGTPYQFNAINPYTGFTSYIPFENQQFGPAYDGNPGNGYIGAPDANGDVFKTPFSPTDPDPRRAFFVNGVTTQSDISVTSGDSRNSNFLSAQYVGVKGTTPKDVQHRANVRFAGKRTYGVFSYDYTINYTDKNSNTVGTDFTGWPVYWVLLNTPANIPITKLKDWQDPTSFGNISNYYNAYYSNPYWAIDNSRNTNRLQSLVGLGNLNLKPTDWLNLTYRLSAQVTNNIYKSWRNMAQFSGFAKSDPWGEGNYESGGNVAGAVTDQTTLNRNLQQDALVTLEKEFGNLNTTLIVGNTIQDQYTNQQYQSTGNLYIPGLYNIQFATGIPSIGSAATAGGLPGGTQGSVESRLIGTYADLQLGWNDVLFLHGAYRHDQSSLLAPGHNTYDVYAVDASWVFSDNIAAIKNSRWFSYGKLHGAYSSTGQITLNPYSTVNTFNVTGGYPYGGLASLSINGTYNNPLLTPEKTVEQEVGLDLGFLQNRLMFNVTYYTDNNTKQLFPVSLTTATGYTNALVNAARTVSSGWEFDAKLNAVKTHTGFRWDVSSNFAIQNTEVKNLYGGAKFFSIGNNNEAIVGYSFPELYVQDLNRDPQGHVVVDGTTGLPSLSSNYVAAGRTTPHYILGLTNTFQYKNLGLQIIADYRGGYVFFNYSEETLDFTGASSHTAANGRQNFIYPNSVIADPANSGKYIKNTSVYTQDGNIGFWAYSAYRKAGTTYTENAAAWKIRTISLNYDFTSFFKHLPIVKGVNLKLLVNNALMFRPKENDFTDPEFNSNNSNGLGYITIYQLPPTRDFSAVLSVKF
jgi:TonB-linked SusC/RagA family outer membrane protein